MCHIFFIHSSDEEKQLYFADGVKAGLSTFFIIIIIIIPS